jgi:DNA-binding CsgD family transcriptional regulator
VLTGLFDLTPAEAKFAALLTSGRSVKEASKAVGVTERSGRTYLSRIFAKTGTHRQGELIALLGASHPFE